MMKNRKIILTQCYNKYLTVLMEDGEAIELHFFPSQNKNIGQLGEIYVGKVKKILPNINGAFIEIQKGLECYYPLTEKYAPIYTRKLSKKEELCVGDELLVQIQKEALKTKQPMVSGNLNFSGHYVVLTSGNKTLSASSKLSKARRAELLAWAETLGPLPYGIIFRTNTAEASFDDIEAEIRLLHSTFEKVVHYGTMRTCYSLVYQLPNPAISILKDFHTDSLAEIVVDHPLFDETMNYLNESLPELVPLVRAYTDKTYPLVKCYRLEHIVDEARQERVWMKSGAYLVIQPTEALTVIDVNSGKCLKKNSSLFDINKEAAKEAAKQIRLRNLSGIIIIDFVNMNKKEEQEELLRYLQYELNKDSNPGMVVGMTKLQLVEITRKKIRKTLEESIHG